MFNESDELSWYSVAFNGYLVIISNFTHFTLLRVYFGNEVYKKKIRAKKKIENEVGQIGQKSDTFCIRITRCVHNRIFRKGYCKICIYNRMGINYIREHQPE